jgi:4-cresol dehydrogenase (hydroxylating)
VILHLGRLDRILEINETLAYAVIEPGVTYRQLRAYLDQHHPDLWCDCTDGPPDGSVIGNALDRGLGVTHYADHFGSLCGLEVVLPTGEVVRTGGGPEGCKTWHTHKWGVGPYVEGLFSQSNLGVVTKAGVWLMPKPEAFASFTFDLKRSSDLPQLVDTVRDLALRGVLQSACHIVNEVVALCVLTQYPGDLLERHSRLPSNVLADLCRRYGVAPWSLGGGIQGTKAMVRDVKRQLRKALSPLGRLTFLDDRSVSAISSLSRWSARSAIGRIVTTGVAHLAGKSEEMLDAAPHVHSVLKGIPSDFFVRHAYFKSRLPKPQLADPDRDDIGLIWFAPIAPMTGRHVSELLQLCQPHFERYGFDFYVALLMQNARSMIVLMSIFFLKDDPPQVQRGKELYKELTRATTGAGYQQYRVSVTGMPDVPSRATEFGRFTRDIKATLDPHCIVAPGKYGT